MATALVPVATEDMRQVPQGTACDFLGWDDDGDVRLLIGGLQILVFIGDLDLCSLL